MSKQTLHLSGVHYNNSDPALLFLEDEESGETYKVSISDFPATPFVDQLKAHDAFTVGYLFSQNNMLQEEAFQE